MTTPFLAAEILRMGESLKHPDRVPGGVNYMTKREREDLLERFVEYSMDLAERNGGSRPPRSLP